MLILSNIPEGASEQQIAVTAGRVSEVLQVSFRPPDIDGMGWAIIAFATPELAKAARERLQGKSLPGLKPVPLDAALGEGLYGAVRRFDEQDSPWKEARTPKGEVYYYHAVTRQTSWSKPAMEFPPVPPPPGAAGFRPPFMTPPRPPPAGRPPGGMLGLGSTAMVSSPPPAQAAINAAQATAAAAAAQSQGQAAPTGAGPLSAPGPVGANLFVYHIPNSWDDGILRQHFEHFGSIVSCRVQKDNEGRPRGFGFVSFNEANAAQAAIAGMHGFPVEGKWLKVQLKKGDEQLLVPPGSLGPPPSIGGPSLAGMSDVGTSGEPGPPPPPPSGLSLALRPAAPPPPRPGPY